MFDYLAAYLEATVTPEQKQVVIRACELLVEQGFTDHNFVIEQELQMADNLDGDVAMSMVNNYLIPVYRQQLLAFGVTVTDDITLTQCTDFLEALTALENYDDGDAITNACDALDGPEAALADLLELTGQNQSEDYLLLIERVSPDLIERVLSTVVVDPFEQAKISEQLPMVKARLEKLVAVPGIDGGASCFTHYLAMGGKLGVDVEHIVAPYRVTLEAIKQPPSLAHELLLLVSASNLSDSLLYTAFKYQLEQLHLSTDAITGVDIAYQKLQKFLSEGQNAQA